MQTVASLAAGRKPTYKPTIETFLTLLEDTFEGTVRLNKLSSKPEQLIDGKWEPWGDADDAVIRLHFQSQYDLYNKAFLDDAFRIFLKTHAVDPLLDMLNNLHWDGVHRIEECLIRLTGCEDTPYTREVSRLLFAGGIHRAYRPGCKFDDVPVLVGRQGGGKSAVARLLAMEDEFFREVKTFDGKEGVEALSGGWIIEIPEMLAAARASEVELVKAYITRQEDTYRVPYDRYVNSLKRRCIFIGTANNYAFLSADKTGNRRFYPIDCKVLGYEFFDRIEEHREYVRQCWAEAKALFDKGELKPYASFDLLADIREVQENSADDDPKDGLIRAYCDRLAPGSRVCVMELWERALHQDPTMRLPSKRDSMDIGQTVLKIPGWERIGKAYRHPDYGVVKGFLKAFEAVERPPDCPF